MKAAGDVKDALNYFKTKKNKNLYFLAKKRCDIVINPYQYFLLPFTWLDTLLI